MSVALLFPIVPDFAADYWVVGNTSTALTVTNNGCRIHLDHQARVLNARKMADAQKADTAIVVAFPAFSPRGAAGAR